MRPPESRLITALEHFVPKSPTCVRGLASFAPMILADRIAQCTEPFLVQNMESGKVSRLSGAADMASQIERCPTRYVLGDDLTRLCAALAYSKSNRTYACADLLHIPAQRIWIEWCEAPWRSEMQLSGLKPGDDPARRHGRRGAMIHSSADGRRGSIRTVWAISDGAQNVLASSMEAYFNLDTLDGEDPGPFDSTERATFTVADTAIGDDDLLRRCFRFRYEATWENYYAQAPLSQTQRRAVARHSLGDAALGVPFLLAFFLLLATRSGLPRKAASLERLNRARARSHKTPLLEHVEVFAPLLPEYTGDNRGETAARHRIHRLHHVRGHLVRRGSKLFWRVPHLRGDARSGAIRSRVVTWQFDSVSIRGRHQDGSG